MIRIEQLTAKAGVQSLEYSLRNDGNAMFLSVPEIGAWKATLNYDPLYVDVVIGKMIETRTTNGDSDQDLFAVAVEYYLENKGKVQVIIFLSLDIAASASLIILSSNSLTVGTSLIKPTPWPQLTIPASMSPSLYIFSAF